jgi:pyruvate kinase
MSIRPTLTESCTKIIATVGPACASVDRLAEMIDAGVDIFRINAAHGDRQAHQEKLDMVRAASQKAGFQAGVLLDLAGPKIRLGELIVDPLPCELGGELIFIRGDKATQPNELTSTYPRLVDELAVGDSVMLADGTIALRVTKVDRDRAVCQITTGGELRSRQGINLPGVALSVQAMRPDDFENALWAAKQGVDMVSLSFVRSAEDVRALKNLLSSYESSAMVVAKIEKREALQHLEEIVEATDAVMVARGDLGVEIDVAEMPAAQKRIIAMCKEKMRPVIVATQMLDSMHHSRRPTRAEATDVANAILDGADACMLSGETAIGDYPLVAVEMMDRIMQCTERELLHGRREPYRPFDRVHPTTSAVAASATTIAETIRAKLVVVATRTGGTAWVKSKQRSLIPTLGVSNDATVIRRMNLFWGIKPLTVSQLDDPEALFQEISRWGCEHGLLAKGDQIVFVAGNGVMGKVHNLLVVHTV